MLRTALAFAAGAVAGGLFVRWYIKAHPGELIGGAVAEKIFGADSQYTKLIRGVGTALDQGFVQ